ncbi:alanine/ornithine racemase family PLP-dependent enzyme [Haloarchaeobius litoreus]|uniref:Alanine/ornithine racemase family PLP-dependent enzyme n=1 Tax=Haloarchaeobius litoreus TaxID=755306 RepID=A0ABD6DMQ3_9EURY|nr:alanine/ornithine racemase family PLP-dependent enzyme [Haloarchaeobius litoreus]
MAPPDTRGVDAPTVHVDLDVVRENARAVCARFDGRVVGVTKAVTGDPAVARAMLDGGVDGVGDSRILNLSRLAEHVDAERTLLVSSLRDRDRVVTAADRSLHSEVAVLEAVATAARERGVEHDVLVMVDTGDRREGVLPEDLRPTLHRAVELDGVRVVGVGTNVGCFGGVLPTAASMGEFVSLVEESEAALGRRFPVISGGSSVTLPLVEAGTLPDRVNELRVGEAILLGTDVTRDRTVPYLRNDAFTLRAEVIECKRKPSTPAGPRGRDVDGDRPGFEDRGVRERAIVAVGEQDVVTDELVPLADGVEVVGASSDHTVCDITDATARITVGDTLSFRPGYRALVQAFTSEYVGRTYHGGTPSAGEAATER